MVATASAQANSSDPYCSNCGYALTGLTESSKCPECGRPIVEVLTRAPRWLESGKRYRSKATIFGVPVIDIAIGPKNGELRGKAVGFIAIGDFATGVLALGGLTRGIVAIGGLAFGLITIGGVSVGLLAALGGLAIGTGMSNGGLAIGALASAGCGIGLIAQGGACLGWCARGGQPVGVHVINFSGSSSTASAVFDKLSWFFGSWPPTPGTTLNATAIIGAVALLVSIIIVAIALLRLRSES